MAYQRRPNMRERLHTRFSMLVETQRRARAALEREFGDTVWATPRTFEEIDAMLLDKGRILRENAAKKAFAQAALNGTLSISDPDDQDYDDQGNLRPGVDHNPKGWNEVDGVKLPRVSSWADISVEEVRAFVDEGER